jgi:hypothetical protein
MRYGTNNIEATQYVNGIAFCIRIRLCSCGGFKFEDTFQLMQCCLGLNLDNISEMFKTKLEEI